jgi:hypothetical protein
LGLVLALATPMAASVGCGAKQNKADHAKVKPGDMPAEGEWTGVYYSQLFGHLHLIKDGDAISGRWRTAAGDKWGEMHGKVTGDLFQYEWTEHKIGMIGPGSSATGKGYFRYIVPPGEHVDHIIRGEWGLASDNAGSPWEAIKQRNQAPDPDSVMPDETQRVQESGWDQGKPSSSGDQGGDDWE